MSALLAPALFEPLRPWVFGDLRPHAYNLVVADPPWQFAARSDKGERKGAAAQYRCYPVEEIEWRFPVPQLAEPTCLLLCWATAPLIDRQISLIKRWGFEFKTLTYWRKVFATGGRAIGTGYRVRGQIEPVIVATKGSPQHKPFDGEIPGVRREHSRKPEEFYQHLHERSRGLTRRADVFARTARPGWDSWGDEVGKFDQEVA